MVVARKTHTEERTRELFNSSMDTPKTPVVPSPTLPSTPVLIGVSAMASAQRVAQQQQQQRSVSPSMNDGDIATHSRRDDIDDEIGPTEQTRLVGAGGGPGGSGGRPPVPRYGAQYPASAPTNATVPSGYFSDGAVVPPSPPLRPANATFHYLSDTGYNSTGAIARRRGAGNFPTAQRAVNYHSDDNSSPRARRQAGFHPHHPHPHRLQGVGVNSSNYSGRGDGSGGTPLTARRALEAGVWYHPRRGHVSSHLGNAVNMSVGRGDLALLHQRDRIAKGRSATPSFPAAAAASGVAGGASPSLTSLPMPMSLPTNASFGNVSLGRPPLAGDSLRESDLAIIARRTATPMSRRGLRVEDVDNTSAIEMAAMGHPSQFSLPTPQHLSATSGYHSDGGASIAAGASGAGARDHLTAIDISGGGAVAAGEDAEEDDGPLEWSTAVRDLTYLAAPASISLMMTYMAGVITVSFVGTMLGATRLAGASVGLFACNILLYPIIGLTYAVDTLVSQEFGRNPESDEQGLIAQRGHLVNLVAMVPVCVILFFRDSILHQLYPAQLANNASEFLRYSPWYIIAVASTSVMAKYLNNQRLPHLVTYSLSSTLIVLPPVLRVLLPAYGLDGAMIAMSIGAWTQLLCVSVLTYWNLQSRSNWGAWRIGDAIADVEAMGEHLKLALPSSVFVALEACAFDVSVLLAGALSDIDGDVWGVVLNMMLILIGFPGGFVSAVTACVGTAIGEGKPDNAKRYAIAGVLLACGVALVNDCIMYAFYDQMLSLFTDHKEIIEGAHRIKWICITLHFFDAAQFVFQGIFSGAGRNDQGAMILMVSLWGIGIPIAAFSPHVLHLSKEQAIMGVVGGLCIGLISELPVLLYVVSRWDWVELCESAMEEEEVAIEAEEAAARKKAERAVVRAASQA